MAQAPMPAAPGRGSPYQLPGASNNQRAETVHVVQGGTKGPIVSGASIGKPKRQLKFFAATAPDIFRYVLDAVAGPGVKGLLLNMGTTALQALFNGVATNQQPKNTAFSFNTVPARQTYPSYQQQSAYVQGYTTQQVYGPPPEGVDSDIGDIYVASREDALALKEGITAEVQEYGQISACRLAEMVGQPMPYTGHDWGWFTARGMNAECDKKGNWRIVLPAPVPLKK